MLTAITLRKWCLEKHKAQFICFQLSFLQVYIGRLLEAFKNPSVVSDGKMMVSEWVMVKLSFVSFIMDGQWLVQILPALSNTGIASKLNFSKVKLAFCRENSVTLFGEEI